MFEIDHETDDIRNTVTIIDENIFKHKYQAAENLINEVLDDPQDLSPDEIGEVKRKLVKVFRKTRRAREAVAFSKKALQDDGLSEKEKLRIESSCITAIIAAERYKREPDFREAKSLGIKLINSPIFDNKNKLKVISKMITMYEYERDFGKIYELVKLAESICNDNDILVIHTQLINVEMFRGDYYKAEQIANNVINTVNKGNLKGFEKKSKAIAESKLEAIHSLRDLELQEKMLEQKDDSFFADLDNVNVLETIRNAKNLYDIILAMAAAKKSNIDTIIKQCSSFLTKQVNSPKLSESEKKALKACNELLKNKKRGFIEEDWDKLHNILSGGNSPTNKPKQDNEQR